MYMNYILRLLLPVQQCAHLKGVKFTVSSVDVVFGIITPQDLHLKNLYVGIRI